ncbi:phosphatase PAP2 family protein [Streptomyces tsukubensis]
MRSAVRSWRITGGAAAALFTAGAVARRSGLAPLGTALCDAGTVLGLLSVWQLTGHLSSAGKEPALDRAARIHRAELRLGFPNEASWQRVVLPRPWLVKAANRYYAVMHGLGTAGTLIWVFVRHQHHFRRVWTALVLVTAGCLIIQFVPVAPPRMLPQNGFVDVAVQYGQSMFDGTMAGLAPNELAAMPSVHVAWCLLVALVAARLTSSHWRWLGTAHAAVTIVVVVVTANHFWADGVAALLLLLLLYSFEQCAVRLRRWNAGPSGGI